MFAVERRGGGALLAVVVEILAARLVEAAETQVHQPPAWELLQSDVQAVRSLDRTDLQGLAHVRNCYST
jgi:hypothetical protein